MMEHGLTSRDLDTIGHILATYAEQITQVELFGSRATGTYRDNSDVDILLHGTISQAEIDHLWTLFHESNLPMSVDVNSYELTTLPKLKMHMEEVRKPLFKHEDLRRYSEEVITDGI